MCEFYSPGRNSAGLWRFASCLAHMAKKTAPEGAVFMTLENQLSELVHGVVFTTGEQCVFTREVLFVIIANVRTGEILVFH